MTPCVGLLRAVNLGAYNKVAMADLRALLERLGMKEVKSLLRSGNVVFQAAARMEPSRLERLLEKETAAALGVATDYFVRTREEWDEVIAANPFKAEAKKDPGHLLVMCLKGRPGKDAVGALEKAIVGRERIRTAGRHAYLVYPDGVGRSRLTNVLIERHLGTRGTARNWNTVLKLREAMG